MSCNCRFRKKLLEMRHPVSAQSAVYLDYNATTPMDPSILGVMDKIQRRVWYNSASLHSAGLLAWQEAEQAIENISIHLNVDKEGLTFCHSASQAIHQIINQVLTKQSFTLCTSSIEHSSIHKQARINQLSGGKALILPVDTNGQIDLNRLSEEAGKQQLFLFISPVNHETGSVQPIKEIFSIVKKSGGIVAFDAVQCLGRVESKSWQQYCDLFVISGHKIYGPQGIGAVWINQMDHRFLGNWKRHGYYHGTLNVSAAAGLAAAVELHCKTLSEELKRMRILIDEGLKILSAGLDLHVNSPSDAVPGILNISLPWIKDMEKIFMELDKQNIYISRYSACSRDVTMPSRVLSAMGALKKHSLTSFRICLGRNSSRKHFFLLRDIFLSLHKQRI